MSIGLVFRAYLPLAVLALVSELLLQIFAQRKVSPLEFDLIAYLPNLLPVTFFFVVGALGVIAFRAGMQREPGVSRSRRLIDWFRSVPWLEMIFARIIPAFLYLELIQSSFAAFKPNIPGLVPFSWDPEFAALDRLLMFGTDPWIVSHALMPSATATWAIDKLYVIWFVVLIASYLFIMVQPLRDAGRLAVMISIGIAWMLLGGLVATVFSSAGPIFYEQVYDDATFRPLVERLTAQSAEASPVHGFSVLNASDLVWKGYAGEPGYPALGISAFPSMHVSMVALIWLFARYKSRIWGTIAFAYMIAILIGSVHLGWHYLVDGLFSIVASWLLWVASLRFATQWLEPVGTDLSSQSSNVVT